MSSTSDCFRVAILIISTSLFNSRASKASIGDDDSLVDPSFDILRSDPFKLVKVKLISDQPDSIKTETLTITDQLSIDLLITTGGTGLHPHDHTPDVIEPLLTRKTIGISHALISNSLRNTIFGSLSRTISGIRNQTLIICLPGSPPALHQSIHQVLLPILPHSLKLIQAHHQKHFHHLLHQSQSTHSINPSSHHHPVLTLPSTDPAHRIRQSIWPIISLSEAIHQSLHLTSPLPHQDLNPDHPQIVGRVLLKDIYALHDQPARPTSNVDGYAISGGSPLDLYPVLTPQSHPHLDIPIPKGSVYRINTGAPLPLGTDAVVMVEDTELGEQVDQEERTIRILTVVLPGQHVRARASDIAQGDLVLRAGTFLSHSGGEISSLVSVGAQSVEVGGKPRVVVLSTGDELVNLAQSTQHPSKTIDSNRPALVACLRSHGCEVIDVGIVPDSRPDLAACFNRLLNSSSPPDLIITSGGTSMGEADVLKPVLQKELAGKIVFARCAVKPGKPTVLATLTCPVGGKQVLVFGLPGNPASAFVMTQVLVVPCLRKMAGFEPSEWSLPSIPVEVDSDFALDDHRPEYVRARIRVHSLSGSTIKLVASTTGFQRSSRATSLAGANGLLKFPAARPDRKTILAGETVEAMMLESIW